MRPNVGAYQACTSAAHASMLTGVVERLLDWTALGATVSFEPDSGRKGDDGSRFVSSHARD